MKLMVVSSWFPYPPDNGSKARAFNLVSRLAERHTVSLLSFAEDGEGDCHQALSAMCRDVQIVPGNPFKPRAPLDSLDLFSRTPRSYMQTYSSQMQALVDAAVPRHDAAVALQLGAALYLSRHTGLPRVFDEAEAGVLRDDYYSQPLGMRRLRRGLTWWKFTRFLRQVTRGFERTTVVSDVELGHLREMKCDSSAIRVVPNGVERDALGRRNTPRPGRLIYPGAITYSANFDAVRYFVDDIFPLVRAGRGDASFIVTGATGNVDFGSFSDRGPVVFTGRMNDVSHLIGQSSVCVVPLRIGGGTRLKILQAMALGTPVVTTTKGAEGLEVTPETDILIADTPSTFAAQVLRVLDDFVLRARLSTNGRRLVERLYTWDRIGSQFEDVLSEAQEANRSRALAGPRPLGRRTNAASA
jgi:glycosyltransferase involved in cell wall biosynthesis